MAAAYRNLLLNVRHRKNTHILWFLILLKSVWSLFYSSIYSTWACLLFLLLQRIIWARSAWARPLWAQTASWQGWTARCGALLVSWGESTVKGRSSRFDHCSFSTACKSNLSSCCPPITCFCAGGGERPESDSAPLQSAGWRRHLFHSFWLLYLQCRLFNLIVL